MDVFQKKCPTCGKPQIYKLRKNFNKAVRLNRICRGCMYKSLGYRDVHRKNTMAMWNDPTKRSSIIVCRKDAVESWRKSAIPTFNSDSYNKKQRVIQKQILMENPQKVEDDRIAIKKLWADKSSVYHTEGFREKLREHRIEQIKKLGVITSNYNPEACRVFDDLNRKNGWNLQHALNGGECKVCGYFLDAYDSEKNIVVEYDEPHHYCFGRKLKNKDSIRQSRIIERLNPTQFLRYDEEQQNLYDVIVGKEK